MSKELDRLEYICKILKEKGIDIKWLFKEDYNTIKQRLEAIDNAKPSEALDKLLDRANHDEYLSRIGTEEAIKFLNENQMFVTSIKQALLKAQEQEKENELLKEIIKSLFDRGCPLHQYIDSKGVLQIEVDDECSNMRLGEYKGVDLDKKLKEVLG